MTNQQIPLNLHQNEAKLYQDQTIDKDDLQTHMIQGDRSLVYLNERVLEKTNLLIGISNKEGAILRGNSGEDYFCLGGPKQGTLRVTMDLRKQKNIKYHVTKDDQYYKLTENSNDDSFFVLLLDNPSFLQLSIYDGKINQRISHIFVTAPEFMKRLRIVGYSIINQRFEGFMEEYYKASDNGVLTHE